MHSGGFELTKLTYTRLEDNLIVVVLNSHNQVRGRRTGSSHSGAEEYPMEKHKQPEMVHAYTTADAINASTRRYATGDRKHPYRASRMLWFLVQHY